MIFSFFYVQWKKKRGRLAWSGSDQGVDVIGRLGRGPIRHYPARLTQQCRFIILTHVADTCFSLTHIQNLAKFMCRSIFPPLLYHVSYSGRHGSCEAFLVASTTTPTGAASKKKEDLMCRRSSLRHHFYPTQLLTFAPGYRPCNRLASHPTNGGGVWSPWTYR